MKIKKISYNKLNKESQDLVDSFKQTGFAVITGYPVSFLDQLYDRWRTFFQMSDQEKLFFKFDPEKDLQSGYFPYKSENAKGESLPDLKEFYQYYNGSDVMPSFQLKVDMYFYKIHMMTLAHAILDVIGKDTGQMLNNAIYNGNTLTRVINYPEIPDSSEGVRAAAHEDINFITLLPASTNPGLQVKDAEGQWHDVGTEAGDIVVNVGDMLQMLTKGKYKSTTHRVINLPGDRLSIPTFVHPCSDFSLGDMTAGEYLRQRLEEIGLK